MKAVFVDIETNGLDFDIHVPIEICVAVVDYSNKCKKYVYTSCITYDAKEWELSDLKALEVNGFNPDCVWQGKPLNEVSKELEDFLVEHKVIKDRAFFICQNPSFDRPFFNRILNQKRMTELKMPYHWLDLASMYWFKFFAQNHAFNCTKVSLSKDSIARSLRLPEEEKPHRAFNGVEHLILCYNSVLETDLIY